MQTIAELLAEGVDIRYGHTVTKVDHSGQGVRISTKEGKTLEADFVVCTVSLGVLKVWTAALCIWIMGHA